MKSTFKYPSDIAKQIFDLSDQGESVREIASKVGMSSTQVYRYLSGETKTDDQIIEHCQTCKFNVGTLCSHPDIRAINQGNPADCVLVRRKRNKMCCNMDAKYYQPRVPDPSVLESI